MDAVTGQVLRVRSLSGRLAFADVKLASTAGSAAFSGEIAEDAEVIELVIKERGLGSRLKDGAEAEARDDDRTGGDGGDGGEKSSQVTDALGVTHVPTTLKLFSIGDVVRFRGAWETATGKRSTRFHRSFRCGKSITVVRAWSSANAGAFTPVFTPLSVSETSFSSKKLCKFYASSLSCPKGDRCGFKHSDDPLERRAWVQNRRAKKRERQALKGDPLNPHEKFSKGARGDVFAQFVVDTFGGADVLGAGAGVLDVAGGRGDVYFELVHKRNIATTIIDPRRDMRLSKKQRRWLKRRKLASGSIDRGGKGNHLKAYFNDDFAKTHGELLAHCSVILGMHPDEATEWIVDLAIKHSKPFAIVPCCVFPKNGEYMSFDRWVDYLVSKSPDIQRHYLNFQGKNLVLFSKGGAAEVGEGPVGIKR